MIIIVSAFKWKTKIYKFCQQLTFWQNLKLWANENNHKLQINDNYNLIKLSYENASIRAKHNQFCISNIILY